MRYVLACQPEHCNEIDWVYVFMKQDSVMNRQGPIKTR